MKSKILPFSYFFLQNNLPYKFFFLLFINPIFINPLEYLFIIRFYIKISLFNFKKINFIIIF
jgi:hypothetical protein